MRYRLRNFILLVLSIFALQSGITFADGFGTFISYLFEGLSEVYSVITKISMGVAAIVIATSIFSLITGGKTAVEKIYNIILYAALALIIIWLAPVIVKAANTPLRGYVKVLYANDFAEVKQVAHLSEIMSSVFNAAKLIVDPLCVMGIVYGAWIFFSINILGRISTARQVEQGKAIIKYSILALIAFYLLPIVINSSYALFHSHAWSPPAADTLQAIESTLPIN